MAAEAVESLTFRTDDNLIYILHSSAEYFLFFFPLMRMYLTKL